MKIFLFVLLLVLLNASSVLALSNPASQYCLATGNKSDIRQTNKGSFGVCTLKTGETCEEWKYFNKECGLEPAFWAKGSTSITYALILSFSLGVLATGYHFLKTRKNDP